MGRWNTHTIKDPVSPKSIRIDWKISNCPLSVAVSLPLNGNEKCRLSSMVSQKIDTFPMWTGMMETQATHLIWVLSLAKFPLWRKLDKALPEGRKGQIPGSLPLLTHSSALILSKRVKQVKFTPKNEAIHYLVLYEQLLILLNFSLQSYMVLCLEKSPLIHMDFPGGSDGRESACNAGDPVSIPESGRSPGEGNGNPLQYSCLENSIDRPWGHKESNTTESLTPFFLPHTEAPKFPRFGYSLLIITIKILLTGKFLTKPFIQSVTNFLCVWTF